MPGLLDLPKARRELDEKDLLTIERETAITWGGRAAASYECALDEAGGDQAEAMRCFWEGETYRAEALEHAAMTEDPALLDEIRREIEAHRSQAREALTKAGHAAVEGGRTPRGRRPAAGTKGTRRAGERPVDGEPGGFREA
jgi:hypothetical protein